MSSLTVVQNSFNAGELSPLMSARIDQSRYSSGCRTLYNMLVHPHGGAYRRSGMRFMGLAHDWAHDEGITDMTEDDAVVRLVPFIFSETQAYVLEFTHKKIRFWYQGGLILDDDNEPFTVETPWPGSELNNLSWCQSADMLYLVSHYAAPQRLERYGHADWQLVEVSFVPGMDAPTNFVKVSAASGTKSWQYVVTALHYETSEESLPSEVLTVSGPDTLTSTDSITMSWDAVENAGEYRVYRAGGGTSVYGLLGTAGEGEQYTDTGLSADFDTGPPEERNPFEGEGNWPSCAVFWQQRLCFAGSESGPQTVWASRSGAYNNFTVSRPLRDDDAVTVTIAADTVSAVHWITPTMRLLIGTGGDEWTLAGISDQAFSPSSCELERQSVRGVADIRPISVGDTILAVQRDSKVVREYAYSLTTDGYSGTDLSILAEHLTENNRIIDWAWQQLPNSAVWCVMEDGTLTALTRIAEHEIVAWHRHETDGKVDSICCIPGEDGDEVWLAIRRENANGEQFCIERLDPPFTSTTVEDAFFVDSGLSYEGEEGSEPVSTLWGLDHLEGRTVHILADGAVMPPRVVENGMIELDMPSTHVHVGLPYVSDLEPLPPEGLIEDVASIGKARRITRVRVRLYKTLGLWLGPDADNLYEVPFRTMSDDVGTALPLWSGDKELPLNAALDSATTACLRQVDPLPMTVLAVAFEIEGGDM